MVGVLVIDGLGDEVCDWLDVHVIDELGLYDSSTSWRGWGGTAKVLLTPVTIAADISAMA
jgi:hypothetical protein